MHHRSHDQHPDGGVPPGGLHPGRGLGIPPPPELEKRAVRILLECFLVLQCVWSHRLTKNELYKIVWRCSYCTSTEAVFDTVTEANGFQTHFIGSVHIIGSVPLSVSVGNTVNHKDVINLYHTESHETL